ncbi:MAG: hypothetical protein AAB209_08535, partial [Bacteroidota bacterium]
RGYLLLFSHRWMMRTKRITQQQMDSLIQEHEPDYTNIEGGLGVFALSSTIVVTADTLGNLIANP